MKEGEENRDKFETQNQAKEIKNRSDIDKTRSDKTIGKVSEVN